jgi:hypothetical protein
MLILDENRLLYGNAFREFDLIDIKTGTKKPGLSLKADLTSWILSAQKELIAVGGLDGTLALVDAKSLKTLWTAKEHFLAISNLTFSTDGAFLVTASNDDTAIVWDVKSGKMISRLEGHAQDVVAADFLPGNKRVVTASSDKTVRLWDVTTGVELTTVGVIDPSAGNSKEIVRTGYDRVSETYRGDRLDLSDPEYMKYAGWIEELKVQLGPSGNVLDLGCGNGVPVARLLVEAGYGYVGVDLSPVQIERARRLTPHAEFICGDMSELQVTSERFSAVVSLYAMIHLPLEEQRDLLERIHQWLQPGGVLMMIVGATEWTGGTMYCRPIRNGSRNADLR